MHTAPQTATFCYLVQLVESLLGSCAWNTSVQRASNYWDVNDKFIRNGDQTKLRESNEKLSIHGWEKAPPPWATDCGWNQRTFVILHWNTWATFSACSLWCSSKSPNLQLVSSQTFLGPYWSKNRLLAPSSQNWGASLHHFYFRNFLDC